MKFKLLLFGAAIFLTQIAMATVRRVNPASTCTSGCSGADFGTTNAFQNLQDAIDASSSGDEVWVMAGIYIPSAFFENNYSPDPRKKTFLFKNGVDVYGGFDGSETSKSQADPELNNTILSGEIGTSTASDNIYCVGLIDINSNLIIDGLTISDGYCTTFGSTSPLPWSSNSAGGLYVRGNSTVTLSRVKFINNYSGAAGFVGGSAIYLFYNSNLFISESYFNEIYPTEGSYVIASQGDYLEIDGCLFDEVSRGIYQSDNSMLFQNSSIINSGSGSYYYGIYHDGSSTIIKNSIFDYSTSTVSNYMTAVGTDADVVSIENSTILASNGIGYCLMSSNSLELNIINSTLYNQSSNSIVYSEFGDLILQNSIVFHTSTDPSIFIGGGSLTAEYSLLVDNTLVNGVNGNCINCDPSFVDINDPKGSDNLYFTSDDGFNLDLGSPGINNGNNSLVPTSMLFDIKGDQRILSGIVDMGAYENNTPCLIGNTLYVDASLSASGAGGCWSEAFVDLGEALAAIEGGGLYASVETIKVKQGTYKPGSVSTSTFTLIPGVSIYGGYPSSADETNDESLRNAALYSTILEGNLGGGVYAKHIITGSGISSASIAVVLDGFTIRNGLAQTTTYGGGAMYLANCGELYVNYCNFNNNASSDLNGGAISLNNSNTKFNSCNFSSNATGGASSFNLGGCLFINNSSSPSFSKCIFTSNSANIGGAVYAQSGSNPSFNTCEFYSNSATDYEGGAIYVTGASSLTASSSRFSENNAYSGNGGALYIKNGGLHLLTDCTFDDNEAIYGGAIYAKDATTYPTIANSTFYSNSTSSFGVGGAIYTGTSCQMEVFGNVFYDNSAGVTGGAVYASNSRFDASNCTFYSNSVSLGQGGAIFAESASKVYLQNSLFNGNTGSSSVSNSDQEMYFAGGVATYLRSNITQYFTNSSSASNYFQQGPSFISTTYNNDINSFKSSSNFLRLGNYSVGVNNGENAFSPSELIVDQANNQRVQKGKIDIGAYESSFGQQVQTFANSEEDIQLFQGCSELEVTMEANILEFGADNSGENNSTEAFLLASEWIRNNSQPGERIQLNIPEGTYLVGKQLIQGDNLMIGNTTYSNPTYLRLGLPVLDLYDVQNVNIIGQGKVLIKYDIDGDNSEDPKDDLYFGGWSEDFSEAQETGIGEPNSCSLGQFLKLENASCVYINNIEVDGSLDEMISIGNSSAPFTGNNSGVGLQMAYVGFYIDNSDNIAIDDVNIHHFGTDGIQNEGSQNQDIYIYESRFEYNARWAMSIGGGSMYRSVNSSFSLTGHGGYGNAGGAGGGCIDFESTTGRITGAYFKSCQIADATGLGNIMADLNGTAENNYWLYGDINFEDCYIGGSPYAAVHAENIRNGRFENCEFRGGLIMNSGSGPLDKLTYSNSRFFDTKLDGSIVNTFSGTLINFGAPATINPKSAFNAFYSFENCFFEITKTRLFYGSGNPALFPISVNNFSCNMVEVYSESFFSGVASCEGGGKQLINDLVNTSFHSNQIIDMNPIASPPSVYSINCTNSIYFEMYYKWNVSNGSNLIIPESNTRIWRQGNDQNFTSNMSKVQF